METERFVIERVGAVEEEHVEMGVEVEPTRATARAESPALATERHQLLMPAGGAMELRAE